MYNFFSRMHEEKKGGGGTGACFHVTVRLDKNMLFLYGYVHLPLFVL